ncbi:MAG: DUF4118 domain-containing protein [Planctomycetota bacterium]
MTQDRPDPDALLATMRAADRQANAGRLKIFLGACAGVGKTYAMLSAAQARRREGVDLLVGLVETHGRKETESLLEGLPLLSRRKMTYQNVELEEFDLDAALARKPQWILVDELAHTNAPGSRHAKRWQDVQELLDNGIHVYTTMNIQHVESLNDVVARITGITVRETVPNSVLENAHEIEVVDLPPPDLLRRLQEGKVYAPEMAQRAQEGFFREDKLSALRELALRFTAEKVNRQVQQFRSAQPGTPVWPTKERIMVCVGSSPTSAKLIRAAKRLADSLQGDWVAVHVETARALGAPQADRDRVVQHLRLAEKRGGEAVTVAGNTFVEEVLAHAQMRGVTKIVVGRPVQPRWRDWLSGNLVDELIRRSSDVDIYVIRGERDEATTVPGLHQDLPAGRMRAYAVSIGVVALCSLVCALLDWLNIGPTNLVMVYLLGVIYVASRARRGPAILASILSVISFDLFFVSPRFTLEVNDAEYLVTFAAMLLVALVISTLTVEIRLAAAAARLRERRTAAMHGLSRMLASSRGSQVLLTGAAKQIGAVFDCGVVALLGDAKGKLRVQAGDTGDFPLDAKELAVAQWVYDLGQIAGLGTDTLPMAQALYVPLLASRGPVGALGVRPRDPQRLLVPDQLLLLEAFANQTALALERDRIAEEAQKQTVAAEAEQLRGSLLSSVSHDLRTPLTSIGGAAASLLEPNHQLTAAQQRELLETIRHEADRLNRQVSNLLEITRLEGGALPLKKELVPLDEPLGAALNRLEERLAGRPVKLDIPADLPLVPGDPVLLEQLFFNLLDNGVKYAPADLPLEVRAVATHGSILVDIIDHGPGFAEADHERIFQKFYRGRQAGTAQGTGLGLAICKGIVTTHGGRIWADRRPEGAGAVVHFSLPVVAPTAAEGLPPSVQDAAATA